MTVTISAPVISNDDVRLVREDFGPDAHSEEQLRATIATSILACERFVGKLLIRRVISGHFKQSYEWQCLRHSPVASVKGVCRIDADALRKGLWPHEYALDIDANGSGWVRCLESTTGDIEVTYTAGMASALQYLPDPVQQAVFRHVSIELSKVGLTHDVETLLRPFRVATLGDAA